jgi:hypothetical protein
MAGTPKRMCKWDKDLLKDDFPAFKKMVGSPKYACVKCGRVAKSKKHLCKPAPLT